ncbi:hypothetical protein Koombakaat1_00051 [Staphylococcus phage Koomba-kaat_1]|nr:hypothetical protein RP15_gp144 [Staphylococcus phage vB_Sau-RP15]UVD42420.1 hypothetical protein [Staphylococcus phage vB_SauM-V1SA19]UVD42693.1 hypothetical protein [Staphylococcus phage vB_SauM-V1SA22]UXE02841.1 hypothetical protein Koombakaat1_00051 [Staphylococcus phage Koomba-kaat_1]
MKLYQLEHDNCKPREYQETYTETKVYRDKEQVVNSLLDQGYERVWDAVRGYGYYKNINDYKEDHVLIKELSVIDYTEDMVFTKLYEYLDNENILTHHNMSINEVKSSKSERFYIMHQSKLRLIWEDGRLL